MVRLDRIVTRTGDTGTTALGDGTRCAKHHPRICAIGAVDEVNSVFGLVRLEALPDTINGALPRLQNDLFDLGADLAVPPDSPLAARVPRLDQGYVDQLEALIAQANEGLKPLDSFVLPGGSRAAALLHLARTVVRRAEREVVALLESEPERVNPGMLRYLNRLGDLCFVWARVCNDGGRSDVPWVPGRTTP
jgi:cob(I)alamin adenosyltransferase